VAKLSQGVLIAFEGIDGSGKTTQIIKVAQFLENQNYKVTITHEPNHNSPYYKFIKTRVKKRRNEVSPKRALNEFSLEYVLNENSFARKPDLWIILDVTVNLGQVRLHQRNNKGEDQLEIADYQEKVRKNYKKLTKMGIGGKIEWVDASGEENELTLILGTLILKFLKRFQ
jgi:thymidylate kinase